MKVSTKSLDDTVYVMDVALCDRSKNLTQQAGDYGRGPKSIINTHVTEEQIHWLVQAPLHGDQDHQAQVGHHDEDVDEEEEDEGRNRGLGVDPYPFDGYNICIESFIVHAAEGGSERWYNQVMVSVMMRRKTEDNQCCV